MWSPDPPGSTIHGRPGRLRRPGLSLSHGYPDGDVSEFKRPPPRAHAAAHDLGVHPFGAGAASGAAPSVSVVAAADSSSNIPGVELPGPVAAGRLGGGIYDVVYRFSVSPGHVIVASLTGTAGTDYDLYLFDASATSVQSTVGLLKKSTGPTSTESISWPSPFGGTYYIDLNGATNVEGDFRLTLQTVPDSTPPSVSMVLADGRGSTNQLTVPATLQATDDLSGVAEMALSADRSSWTAWQPYEGSTTWTFSPGDGERTLWAKVRNGVGLRSAATTAKVTIETGAPAAIEVEPSPGSSVVGLRPPFSVTFDEAMDPTSWTDLGLIVQSATGTLVPGQYAYDGQSGRERSFRRCRSARRYRRHVRGYQDAGREPHHSKLVMDDYTDWHGWDGVQGRTEGRGARCVLSAGSDPERCGGSGRRGHPGKLEFLGRVRSVVDAGCRKWSGLSFVVTPGVNTTYRLSIRWSYGEARHRRTSPCWFGGWRLVGRSSSIVSVGHARWVRRSSSLLRSVRPQPACPVSFRLIASMPRDGLGSTPGATVGTRIPPGARPPCLGGASSGLLLLASLQSPRRLTSPTT